ncbi:MAG TPA: DUF4974 domain-containing protein [Vicinamibacteria bacterium]|jgi:hypothetical protein|nr:DUF4974 domain-containing protein [Vicinamibacteria bacterium]
MRCRGLALALLLLGVGRATAEVDIHSAGGRVDLRVSTAPLSDVLDRLSRETGTKVVYEGPPPRQLVSVSLQKRTPVEAVLSLLEGTGISFALRMDPSGTGCHTLIIVSAPQGIATTAPPPAAPPPEMVPPNAAPEESVPAEAFTPPPGMTVSPPQVVQPPGQPGSSPEAKAVPFPPGFNTALPNFQSGPPMPSGPVLPSVPGGPGSAPRAGRPLLAPEKAEPDS